VIELQDLARFLRHRRVRAKHAAEEAAKHDESSNKTLHGPFASLIYRSRNGFRGVAL
jgi:hypothetical protein